MRIILTQEEIEEAIEKLILDQVNVPDDMRIDILLKATRGDEGYTAEIDIVAHDAPIDGTDRSIDPRITPKSDAEPLGIVSKVLQAKAVAELPRRRGRPAGARNKEKLDSALVGYVGSGIAEASAKDQPELPLEPASAPAEIVSKPIEEAYVIQPGEASVDVVFETEKPFQQLVEQPVYEDNETRTPEAAQAEREPDYTSTPETAGFETSEAQVQDPVEVEQPAPAAPAVTTSTIPVRSLFAR